MKTLASDWRAARIGRDRLAVLGRFRDHPSLRVGSDADPLWVWAAWLGPDAALEAVLRAVPGVLMLERAEGVWRRPGARLGAAESPPEPGGMAPVAAMIVPEAVRPEPPARAWGVGVLRVVRDEVVRPASALRTTVEELAAWADVAVAADLSAFLAAWSGERVLLRGENLPWLAGVRLWGARVLVPLGFRIEPALPESRLAEACGLEADETALIEAAEPGPMRVEVVPAGAFRPLTRAGARLAAGRWTEVST